MKQFLADIDEKTSKFKAAVAGHPEAGIVLLHHNDTDGLSSGAILHSAFTREGYPLRRFCLEKPYPEALEKIFALETDRNSVVVFADFGSGMLPEIARINERKHQVFVIDHHGILPTTDPCIHPLNCLLHSIPGNRDCSASGVCYLFAKALNESNESLAALAVLGAIGDGHLNSSGELTGVNRSNFLDASKQDLASFSTEYFITCGATRSTLELKDCMDALGSFGYLHGGPDRGFQALLSGVETEDLAAGVQLRAEYNQVLNTFLSNLTLKREGRVEWFSLDQSFSAMGVKTVGLVCEEIVQRQLHNPDLYLAGFQQVPDTVPGLGDIDLNLSKISMRVSPALKAEMEAGNRASLADLLPDAVRAIDGFVDACHLHAAAAAVQIGDEVRLIKALSSRIDGM